MTKCKKVVFLQNFARQTMAYFDENVATIKESLNENGGEKLVETLRVHCTDFGAPKLQKFIDSGIWKEDTGQANWLEISADPDITTEAVQNAMWGHAEKLAQMLKTDFAGLIKDNITSGIEEPLGELITFQLG